MRQINRRDPRWIQAREAAFAVIAKGENAKIRELKKRLEKENDPSEISALISAIDALSGYVTKGKEAREKRKKDKADKLKAAEPKPEAAAPAEPEAAAAPAAAVEVEAAPDDAAVEIESTPSPDDKERGKEPCSNCGEMCYELIDGKFCPNCEKMRHNFTGSGWRVEEVNLEHASTDYLVDCTIEWKGHSGESDSMSGPGYPGYVELTGEPKIVSAAYWDQNASPAGWVDIALGNENSTILGILQQLLSDKFTTDTNFTEAICQDIAESGAGEDDEPDADYMPGGKEHPDTLDPLRESIGNGWLTPRTAAPYDDESLKPSTDRRELSFTFKLTPEEVASATDAMGGVSGKAWLAGSDNGERRGEASMTIMGDELLVKVDGLASMTDTEAKEAAVNICEQLGLSNAQGEPADRAQDSDAEDNGRMMEGPEKSQEPSSPGMQ